MAGQGHHGTTLRQAQAILVLPQKEKVRLLLLLLIKWIPAIPIPCATLLLEQQLWESDFG